MVPGIMFSQWQADMSSSISGGKTDYKVYSNLSKYRYEFIQDGMNGVVIVDPARNITAIMLVDDKKVHNTSCDGMMSRMNDPVQAYIGYKQYGDEKDEGIENILGYECTKTTIYQGDTPLFSRWYSDELNFPVKLLGHWAENTSMELSNIMIWDVDPSFFEVPEDYIEVDENLRPLIPEPPPPEKWETIETSLPINMQVERGMAISFVIEEELHYRVIIENTGGSPLKFVFHEFENGSERPDDKQGPPDWRTKRLYMGEDYNMTFGWKPGFTVVFEFYEGEGKMGVKEE